MFPLLCQSETENIKPLDMWSVSHTHLFSVGGTIDHLGLVTEANDFLSMVQNCVSTLLCLSSNTLNKLHLLIEQDLVVLN